jgi:hypothetical protein
MTTETINAVGLIATVCGPDGPSLVCREVLEVAVVDYGGNEYGRATTPRGVARVLSRLRIPTRLQPTKLGGVVPPEAYIQGLTVDCGYCDAGN